MKITYLFFIITHNKNHVFLFYVDSALLFEAVLTIFFIVSNANKKFYLILHLQ